MIHSTLISPSNSWWLYFSSCSICRGPPGHVVPDCEENPGLPFEAVPIPRQGELPRLEPGSAVCLHRELAQCRWLHLCQAPSTKWNGSRFVNNACLYTSLRWFQSPEFIFLFDRSSESLRWRPALHDQTPPYFAGTNCPLSSWLCGERDDAGLLEGQRCR